MMKRLRAEAMDWNKVTFVVFIVAAVLVVLGIDASVKRIERKVARLENYLMLILNHLEIPVASPLSPQVQELAQDPARKIAAIKQYREETGAGLKEAKEAIEEFTRQQNLSDSQRRF
jgi:ribosomal protein L7/L12